jgi:hypothetical protein
VIVILAQVVAAEQSEQPKKISTGR